MTQDEADRAWRRGYALARSELEKPGDAVSNPRDVVDRLYLMAGDHLDKVSLEDLARDKIDLGAADAACAEWNTAFADEIADDQMDVMTPVKWAASLGMAFAVKEAEEA